MDDVSLREVTIYDAYELHSIWNDFEVIRYTMINNMESIENVKSRIERQLKWKENDGIGPFVILKMNTIIGYCGGTKTSNEEKEYEIFYHLKRDQWRKGIGSEVAKKLVDIAFSLKNARRVIAETYVDNIGSCKVLEKIGMRKRETVRRKIRSNEDDYEMLVYEIEK